MEQNKKEEEKKQTNKIVVQSREDSVVSTHSYTKEEILAFTEHLNFYLKDDQLFKDTIPISIEDQNKFFEALSDGVLFCKLINIAQPGTIDEKAINKKPKNQFQINENLNLAINSAKSIGCIIVNIHAQLIREKREHIVLGLLWQIIKNQMLAKVDLKNHPYLIRLKKEEEENGDLIKLPKEELLLRWINYHLKNAKSERVVKNFGKDLQDGECYVLLLNQINPNNCDLTGLKLEPLERAKKIINDARKLGVPPCIKPTDITSGLSNINLIHCAHIFNHCPGLVPNKEDYEAAKLIEDDNDVESSQEERVFKMWINSLNLEGCQINNLIQDLKDGIAICKILEHLQKGTIDQKKINLNPKYKINKIQNANYAVESVKKIPGVHVVGISGTDLIDGNKKLILAIIWQLMKKDQLKLVGEIQDNQILEWANNRVDQQYKVASFKDPKLKTGIFLLRLLASIEQRAVNWELVQEGELDENIANNAKYSISVARKLNAPVFLVWEHIKNVNSKFLLTFVASLKKISEDYDSKKL